MLPYRPERLPEGEMLRRAREYFEEMNRRRSVRFFTSDPVPRALIETAIRTASTAPSGAHKQPWFPVGYPAPDAEVPDLRRKSLSEVSIWLE